MTQILEVWLFIVNQKWLLYDKVSLFNQRMDGKVINPKI